MMCIEVNSYWKEVATIIVITLAIVPYIVLYGTCLRFIWNKTSRLNSFSAMIKGVIGLPFSLSTSQYILFWTFIFCFVVLFVAYKTSDIDWAKNYLRTLHFTAQTPITVFFDQVIIHVVWFETEMERRLALYFTLNGTVLENIHCTSYNLLGHLQKQQKSQM